MSIFFGAKKRTKRNIILTFSSVEKEAKKLSFIHSLAQRTNQETSTPYKLPPIWGSLNKKLQKPPTFSMFWYRGTRDDFFYRLARSIINNLYHCS